MATVNESVAEADVTYKIWLCHNYALLIGPYMDTCGIHAVLPIGSSRDDEVTPKSIDKCLLEVHILLSHHTLSESGVRAITSYHEIELHNFALCIGHWEPPINRNMAGRIHLCNGINRFIYPRDTLKRSYLTLKVTRHKLMVEGNGRIRFSLERQQ